jgi:hypothetical protein
MVFFLIFRRLLGLLSEPRPRGRRCHWSSIELRSSTVPHMREDPVQPTPCFRAALTLLAGSHAATPDFSWRSLCGAICAPSVFSLPQCPRPSTGRQDKISRPWLSNLSNERPRPFPCGAVHALAHAAMHFHLPHLQSRSPVGQQSRWFATELKQTG